MKNMLLKMIGVEFLIEFLIAYLASTVKNPHSTGSLRVKDWVFKLHHATGEFLKRVP